MTYSPFGIHTFTLFSTVIESEAFSIIADFKKYRDKTGEIKIITNDKYPNNYEIKYHGGKGIIWRIRYSQDFQGSIPIYCIDAIINPKVLSSGFPDYFNVANQEEIKIALTKLIEEAKKISNRLCESLSSRLNRVDYCINFDIDKLMIPCTAEQMMELIKRGNIPNHFEEHMQYDYTSRRMKSDKVTLYLKSKSTVVNCYLKGEQLKREYPQTPNIPSNIIRFEIQCKYNKISAMKKGYSSSDTETMIQLLSDKTSKEVLTKYFNRIIMRGNYYTLAEAIALIESKCFKLKKETRLIKALQYVNLCRGISKAKDKLPSDELIIFNRALRELVSLDINPVTIPKDWGMKYINNLMDSQEEMIRRMMNRETKKYPSTLLSATIH